MLDRTTIKNASIGSAIGAVLGTSAGVTLYGVGRGLFNPAIIRTGALSGGFIGLISGTVSTHIMYSMFKNIQPKPSCEDPSIVPKGTEFK